MTPLGERSARCREALPDNKQHSQKTDTHAPVGFEPAIPASERPQIHPLDGADAGIGAK